MTLWSRYAFEGNMKNARNSDITSMLLSLKFSNKHRTIFLRNRSSRQLGKAFIHTRSRRFVASAIPVNHLVQNVNLVVRDSASENIRPGEPFPLKAWLVRYNNQDRAVATGSHVKLKTDGVVGAMELLAHDTVLVNVKTSCLCDAKKIVSRTRTILATAKVQIVLDDFHFWTVWAGSATANFGTLETVDDLVGCDGIRW